MKALHLTQSRLEIGLERRWADKRSYCPRAVTLQSDGVEGGLELIREEMDWRGC